MKTSTLIVLGGLGVGAALLWRSSKVAAPAPRPSPRVPDGVVNLDKLTELEVSAGADEAAPTHEELERGPVGGARLKMAPLPIRRPAPPPPPSDEQRHWSASLRTDYRRRL